MKARDRLYAYAVSGLLLAAVISPAFGDPPKDDFPLSTYPMFARPLRDVQVELPSVRAVLTDGTEQRVPPELVASSDVLQALVSLRHALRQGPDATQRLCEGIAARLGQRANWHHARAVEIITYRTHAVAHFAGGDPTEQHSTVQAHCPVKPAAARPGGAP